MGWTTDARPAVVAAMTEPTKILLIHPDDVNLADTKARAAENDATAIGSQYVPRGESYVIDPNEFPMRWQQ